MKANRNDLSIFQKFNFERSPVGIKFLYHKPEGIEPLKKHLALCEMLKEAQEKSEPFYMSRENENCFGNLVLGMNPPVDQVISYAKGGYVGPKFEIYQEPRANRRIYDYMPKLDSGICNYVAFSRLEALSFDPDVLILTTTISQAEIVLRAMCHSTGEALEPKFTPVLGCAWMFIHPYKTGKMNYTITGLGFGMKNRKVLPEGLMIISIPWDKLTMLTQNLQEMDWEPAPFKDTYEQFLERAERIQLEAVKEARNF